MHHIDNNLNQKEQGRLDTDNADDIHLLKGQGCGF